MKAIMMLCILSLIVMAIDDDKKEQFTWHEGMPKDSICLERRHILGGVDYSERIRKTYEEIIDEKDRTIKIKHYAHYICHRACQRCGKTIIDTLNFGSDTVLIWEQNR